MLCESPSRRSSLRRTRARLRGRAKTGPATSKPNRSCRSTLATACSPGNPRPNSAAAITKLERTLLGDNNKNKTSEAISGTMSGYGFDVGSSGYDEEDRLVNWERDDTNLDQSWDLSLVGDWDSITENTSTQYRTHGAAHEILTAASQSITHDVKGNMTSIPAVLRPGSDPLALSWDFDNRLTGADVDDDSTDDVTYEYDALGRRVQRDDGTTATVFVQNGQQTFADYTSGTAATSPTYNYVYASYIDEPVYRDGTGGDRYFHSGQQYSIVALTDSTGTVKERYAYSAYGTPTITDASGTARATTAEGNRYTYTGREWDGDVEVYHFRARMYDPLSGRFLGRDPIAYTTGEVNLYQYVGSNPTVRRDYSGLTWQINNPMTGDDDFGVSNVNPPDNDELEFTTNGFVYCSAPTDKTYWNIFCGETLLYRKCASWCSCTGTVARRRAVDWYYEDLIAKFFRKNKTLACKVTCIDGGSLAALLAGFMESEGGNIFDDISCWCVEP